MKILIKALSPRVMAAIVMLLFFMGVFSSEASAEPAWKKTIPAFTGGKHPELRRQKLEYVMSWNGKLKSGSLTMLFDKADPRYKKLYLAQAFGRSTGVAGKLFPFSFTYTSFMQPKTYRPFIFSSKEIDKEGTTAIQNTYKALSVDHTRNVTPKGGSLVKKRNKTFSQKNVHDPLSAMLYIRGRALKKGDVEYVCLFPFKSAQYAKVTVLGREKHNGYNCIKLDLKIQNIDLDTHELKAYKKLKKATMWITDDVDRVLVELRSKVFIGDVRTVLAKRS